MNKINLNVVFAREAKQSRSSSPAKIDLDYFASLAKSTNYLILS